jgi:hypothetical protein
MKVIMNTDAITIFMSFITVVSNIMYSTHPHVVSSWYSLLFTRSYYTSYIHYCILYTHHLTTGVPVYPTPTYHDHL